MEFKELITSFGEKNGIEGLSADDGTLSLDIDGMTVEIFHNEEDATIFLCSVVGEPPAEGQERFSALLLQANFLFRGTDGATLSQNPDTKEYALVRVLSLPLLDLDSFSAALEKFVNGVESWKKLLADFRPIVEDAAKNTPQDIPLPFSNNFIQV